MALSARTVNAAIFVIIAIVHGFLSTEAYRIEEREHVEPFFLELRLRLNGRGTVRDSVCLLP